MTEIPPTRRKRPLALPIAVVGNGIAGMTAALAFAMSGAKVALVARDAAPYADPRTAALFPASVRLLHNLGVWQACATDAAPLEAIRIVDATSWLLKAPETVFRASELGRPALAWNIPNAVLSRALVEAIDSRAGIIRISTSAAPAYSRTDAGAIQLETVEGANMLAQLVVAADGRLSPLRAFAGIVARQTALDQVALATTFRHSRPHGNVSTELHRDAGPLTTVPMPGNRSSLVWVERPREAERLIALEAPEFLETLQKHLQGLLGRLDDASPPMSFPLQSLEVDRFAAGRVALIGEAAHVVPPIGAQGLNLSLRDVAELAGAVLPVLAQSGDPGSASVLGHYDRRRRREAPGRARGVGLLNTSLASGSLPLQLARGFGLHAINAIGPLRRTVMRGAAEGWLALPELMRDPASPAPDSAAAAE